jgi:tetratricopeptide (TPR) repeat protein
MGLGQGLPASYTHLTLSTYPSAVDPDRAVPCAERLAGLMPGAGHLVHMPGHIYIRTGRYHDAVRVNQEAAAADERYIAQTQAQGFYPLLYYPHNYNFLWFAAMMGGESAIAIETAQEIQANLTEDMIEAERLRPTLVFSLVRFGHWDELLALPPPPEEQLYATAMWHYGRGLAHLHTGNVEAATADLDALTAIAESESAQDLEQPFFHGLSQVHIAQHILQGERARVMGESGAAISHLRTAVEIQDALPYMEPPYWYYPVRQSLGAALLQAGKPAEAERAFEQSLEDFPNNGWSLYGLMEAQKAQGDEAARETEQRFRQAWAGAPDEIDLNRL